MTQDTIYLARLTVEAASPLAIGSGRRGITTDHLVARDAYGLPYLPGTALAGCLRSSLTDAGMLAEDIDALFGYQRKGSEENNNDNGQGSRVILSAGHLIGPDGKVVGESSGVPTYEDAYLKLLTDNRLPERDHVRINSRGVADAEGHGKFDEQLVPRGVRFVFEIRLDGTVTDADHWKTLLEQFQQASFRLGGGTRKGFGKLKVIIADHCTLHLREADQREAYLDLASALDVALPPAFTKTHTEPATAPLSSAWKTYTLHLKARDFFLFGKGINNAETDKLPKQETVIEWDANGKPSLREGKAAPYLIPATSIKGAISHRTAFHYNKAKEDFIEKQQTTLPTLHTDTIVAELLSGYQAVSNDIDTLREAIQKLEVLRADTGGISLDESATYRQYDTDLKAAQTDEARPNVGENNAAVRALFGYAIERRELTEAEKKQPAQRGRVLIDDVFLPAKQVEKQYFSHVMIDRYTGGAKAGALFNEKVATTKQQIKLELHVHENAFAGGDGAAIKAAFEAALKDLTKGRLPLGGGVAKGHGIFIGELSTPETQQA